MLFLPSSIFNIIRVTFSLFANIKSLQLSIARFMLRCIKFRTAVVDAEYPCFRHLAFSTLLLVEA